MDELDAYSRTVSAGGGRGHAARGQPAVGRGRSTGAGSGVVFTDDGLLLTNAHVVADASRGEAEFTDGTETTFDVVGTDPLSDLAVLRARGGTPPAAKLGDADQLVVGQLVVAVGNPLGLAGSVTAGCGQRARAGRCRRAAGGPAG